MRRPQTYAPLGILVAVIGLCGLAAGSNLRLNLSPSMPLGLYRLDYGAITREALVATCLPREVALMGRQRGFLWAGSCPGGTNPVLKRIGGVGGDVVAVRSDGIFINGQRLQKAAPHFDRQKRSLHALPTGDYLLDPTQLWLYAPEPRSWDSRFYGPVHRSVLLGSVQPIWAKGGREGTAKATDFSRSDP